MTPEPAVASMALYCFDLFDGDDVTKDDTGLELASEEAARKEAIHESAGDGV